MKYITLIATLLVGCYGDSLVGGTGSGQVRGAGTNNPIFCSDWNEVSIGMGGTRDGYGSMNLTYFSFSVQDEDDFALLQESAKTGQLIEFDYNMRRNTYCQNPLYITDVRVIEPEEEYDME